MARSKSVKTLIKDLEPDELREVIVELCKLSRQNRQFIDLFLQGSDVASPEPIVEEGKKKIYACFYGRSGFPRDRIDLRGGRRVVSEYGKILKDYPRLATELKLHYVEVGTRLTDEYGDMYEGFYSSLVSMFESFCKDVQKHPSWYEEFLPRIHDIQSKTSNMGWGYEDDIIFILRELEESLEA